MIRRRGEVPPEDESSSDEEDAFSALSRNHKTDKKAVSAIQAETPSTSKPVEGSSVQFPMANTSSMKRHHASDARKAKMEALLQGMEADHESASSRHYGPGSRDNFVPEKKGSFVRADEEHLTTNIFVGNLDPTITEEQVTDLFGQFGDLHSVKIMWPRNMEERSRNRNTGFVCYMRRDDAQEAMDAFNETDPFRVGRRLMMRWGKHVLKEGRQSVGGPVTPARSMSVDGSDEQSNKRRKYDAMDQQSTSSNFDNESQLGNTARLGSLPYDPSVHASTAIRVVAPSDPGRVKFISTVASFVAKDGAGFERKLIETQAGSPQFAFLTLQNADARQRNEHIFYRWRVYAFCQGDGFHSWRTEPFSMIQPQGRFWVPPPLDREAAERAENTEKNREASVRERQVHRRQLAERKDFMTGRQLEQAKFGRAAAGAADGGATLTDFEMEEFHNLVQKKLCASRDSICEAMAFFFDKSGAAKQLAALLKEFLLDASPKISVETRIARLYLLSDVLFNSQQPGVRNAFLYRGAIEKMAPDVFASLGQHGKGKLGRMTLNKLSTAVSTVLSAWTNWSVYSPTFLDELHARFEGREIVTPKEPETEAFDAENMLENADERDEPATIPVVRNRPRGDWTEVTSDESKPDKKENQQQQEQEVEVVVEVPKEESQIPVEDSDIDGESLQDDDIDGEPLSDGDLEWEPLDEGGDLDGKAMDEADEVTEHDLL